jgi:hypothetical protein
MFGLVTKSSMYYLFDFSSLFRYYSQVPLHRNANSVELAHMLFPKNIPE